MCMYENPLLNIMITKVLKLSQKMIIKWLLLFEGNAINFSMKIKIWISRNVYEGWKFSQMYKEGFFLFFYVDWPSWVIQNASKGLGNQVALSQWPSEKHYNKYYLENAHFSLTN